MPPTPANVQSGIQKRQAGSPNYTNLSLESSPISGLPNPHKKESKFSEIRASLANAQEENTRLVEKKQELTRGTTKLENEHNRVRRSLNRLKPDFKVALPSDNNVWFNEIIELCTSLTVKSAEQETALRAELETTSSEKDAARLAEAELRNELREESSELSLHRLALEDLEKEVVEISELLSVSEEKREEAEIARADIIDRVQQVPAFNMHETVDMLQKEVELLQEELQQQSMMEESKNTPELLKDSSRESSSNLSALPGETSSLKPPQHGGQNVTTIHSLLDNLDDAADNTVGQAAADNAMGQPKPKTLIKKKMVASSQVGPSRKGASLKAKSKAGDGNGGDGKKGVLQGFKRANAKGKGATNDERQRAATLSRRDGKMENVTKVDPGNYIIHSGSVSLEESIESADDDEIGAQLRQRLEQRDVACGEVETHDELVSRMEFAEKRVEELMKEKALVIDTLVEEIEQIRDENNNLKAELRDRIQKRDEAITRMNTAIENEKKAVEEKEFIFGLHVQAMAQLEKLGQENEDLQRQLLLASPGESQNKEDRRLGSIPEEDHEET